MTERIPEIITTQRLQLRRPRTTDVDGVFAYAGDAEVTRFMDWRTHKKAHTVTDWLNDCTSMWGSAAEFTWLMTLQSDERVIGAVSLCITGCKAEFGYVLNRAFWARGFATEAARSIVDLAATIDGVYRVWATCDVDNVASARVLEKIGLTREGILRSWAVRPNIGPIPRDAYMYGKVVRSSQTLA